MIQKPYNLHPTGGIAIDSKEANNMSWSVSGDIQVAYEIKIFNNTNNALVWSLPKTPTYANNFSLPAQTLTNGREYKWQVTIYNDSGKSIASDFQIFQTSTRPVVLIDQLGTISSPSYLFTAKYQQPENISLRSWHALLYNEKMALIGQTGIQTGSELQYRYNDLKSESDYYIEFHVTSIKGLTGSSGKIKFQVLYTQPKINVSLSAENVSEIAGIQLSWNATQIIGSVDTSPPIYINNEKIDLLNNRVIFSKGFSLERNFTIKIWLERPKNKQDLLILKGKNSLIKLQYHLVDNKFHLYKIMNNGGLVTTWISQAVTGSKFFIVIQQINQDFNLLAQSYS